VSRVHLLMKKFPCLQELPPTVPVDQSDEGEWDTVGEAAGSRSPTPIVEELLAQMERQPPAAQGGTEPTLLRKRQRKGQRLQRRRRRRLSRLDWWTSPASSAPRP
jgi:hypothetical protein